MAQAWNRGQAFLARYGLNLVCVFECATLPPALATVLANAVPDWRKFSRLLLVGNGGPGFWQAFQASAFDSADPVDDFSRDRVATMLETCLESPLRHWLYPGPVTLPLQRLGALAGWHHRSPLGIGINQRFGLWFAYRAALLVALDLPTGPHLGGEAPCLGCRDKPCIQACPAGALAATNGPSLQACGQYRLSGDSPCAVTCLARRACPVAPEMRYRPEQLAYHYRRSLAGLRAWLTV